MDNFISESVVKNENPAIAMGVTGKQHLSTVYLMDCIEGMKQYPDSFFDLAVVDPPYGIDVAASGKVGGNNCGKAKDYGAKEWDKQLPNEKYFSQLRRVSKNQIVWGGNYFKLPQSNGWIVWKKMDISNNFTPFELAWTSTDKSKMFDYLWAGMWQQNMKNKEVRIHPTQKPVDLYAWILLHYAKEGDLILDTHLGSQSSRIAACKAGLPFIGFETDQEYFDLGNKRFFDFARQGSLF